MTTVSGNDFDGILGCSSNDVKCPKCDSSPDHREMRNYSITWHDGDIHCTICGTFVRSFDAG